MCAETTLGLTLNTDKITVQAEEDGSPPTHPPKEVIQLAYKARTPEPRGGTPQGSNCRVMSHVPP